MSRYRQTEGFTLIELMIVVAIIAIIAAIAIPSILRSRMSANQTSAVASLDTVLKMNTQFRSNDSDNNGENDYWVENVWGLYGVESAGGDKIKLFSKSLAKSDWEGQGEVQSGNLGNVSMDNTFPSADLSPKSGYYVSMYVGFQSTASSPKTGLATESCETDYTSDGDADSSDTDYTNANRFGTMAFPSLYDSTGTKAYTVTQGGDKFEIDAKSSNLDQTFNNSSDDTPNGTEGTSSPLECKPSSDGLNDFWSSTG